MAFTPLEIKELTIGPIRQAVAKHIDAMEVAFRKNAGTEHWHLPHHVACSNVVEAELLIRTLKDYGWNAYRDPASLVVTCTLPEGYL